MKEEEEEEECQTSSEYSLSNCYECRMANVYNSRFTNSVVMANIRIADNVSHAYRAMINIVF